MYRWNGEGLTTDIASALAAALAGYVTTNMAYKNAATDAEHKSARNATLVNGLFGVGGLAAKYYTGNSMLHEILEGVGFGGFAGLGAWAAAVMKNQASIPVWLPKKPTQSKQSSMIVASPSFRPVSAAPTVSAVSAPAAGWETEY